MSDLFTQIQNELRRYKASGFDLAHPQGVMIGERLYPALQKTIHLDINSTFHYPSFQIPHESGNRTQVVGTAFGGTDSHLIMELVHPEIEYGYNEKQDVNHPSHTRVHRGLEHSWEGKPEVQEATWTWTTRNNTKYHKQNNPNSENKAVMIKSSDYETIHNELKEHTEEPHHSRIWRYVHDSINGGKLVAGGRGWTTLQANMDPQDLQVHSKQTFRQHHVPHLISISNMHSLGDVHNDGKTTHLYNVKTEELTPYKNTYNPDEFKGY